MKNPSVDKSEITMLKEHLLLNARIYHHHLMGLHNHPGETVQKEKMNQFLFQKPSLHQYF